MPDKASAPLLQQLAATLEKDEAQRAELVGKIKVPGAPRLELSGSLGPATLPVATYSHPMKAPPSPRAPQGLVVFVIDGEQWTLDLRQGKGSLQRGPPPEGVKVGGCAWASREHVLAALGFPGVEPMQGFLPRNRGPAALRSRCGDAQTWLGVPHPHPVRPPPLRRPACAPASLLPAARPDADHGRRQLCAHGDGQARHAAGARARATRASAPAPRAWPHAPAAAAPLPTATTRSSALPQAFLMRKLKISGSMGMAMKLQPILDAAAPKAKL